MDKRAGMAVKLVGTREPNERGRSRAPAESPSLWARLGGGPARAGGVARAGLLTGQWIGGSGMKPSRIANVASLRSSSPLIGARKR